MMVMTALDAGIKLQLPRQQRLHRRIRVAGHPATQLNAGLRQRRLCAASDPAADQQIHAVNLQKSCQRSMSVLRTMIMPFPKDGSSSR